MAGTWKRIGSDQSVTGNLKDALTVDVPEPSGDTFTSLMVVLETTGTSGSADCPIFFGTSSAIDHGQNYRYSFNPNNSGLDGDGTNGSNGANVVTRGGSNHCFSVTYINGNQTGKEKFAHGYEVDDNAQTGTGSGAIPRRSHYAFKWTNTSSYVRKISVDTRVSGSASSITFNDKSKMIVYGSIDEEKTDEKTTLTNVPANTRYEETDTRKIYRRVVSSSIGTTKAGATADSNANVSYLTYKQITGLTSGDVITAVTFDAYSYSSTAFKGVVYTDSSNQPSSLLGSGTLASGSLSNTYTTVSITLDSPVTVPSNGIVWVAVIPNTTNPNFRVTTESGGAYTHSVYATDSSPSGRSTNYANMLYTTANISGNGSNNVRFGVTTGSVWKERGTA